MKCPNQRRIGLSAGLAALIALAPACTSGWTVFVDLRTDYVAGAEVQYAEVLLNGESITSVPLRSTDLSLGVRVATLDDVDTGAHQVEVRLLSSERGHVASRVRALDVSAATGVTVVIPRNCAATRCPINESLAATECLNGLCVPPTCSDRNPSACGAAICRQDLDCPASMADCATPICENGACLDSPIPGACAADEVCLLSGCANLTPSIDAGVPYDAAADSAMDTAPERPPAKACWLREDGCDWGVPFEFVRGPNPVAGAMSMGLGSFSPDACDLFSTAPIAGSPIQYDIVWASREGAGGSFGTLSPVVGVNTSRTEGSPSVAGGGLDLIFVQEQVDGTGAIYRAVAAPGLGNWADPQLLYPEAPQDSVYQPRATYSGTSLIYIASNRVHLSPINRYSPTLFPLLTSDGEAMDVWRPSMTRDELLIVVTDTNFAGGAHYSRLDGVAWTPLAAVPFDAPPPLKNLVVSPDGCELLVSTAAEPLLFVYEER